MYNRGKGYYGTDSLKTTEENMEEILDFSNVQKNPANKYVNSFYRFDLDNKNDCTIYVNGSEDGIFLEAGNGWRTEIEDPVTKSIKIKESGVTYKWVGHF